MYLIKHNCQKTGIPRHSHFTLKWFEGYGNFQVKLCFVCLNGRCIHTHIWTEVGLGYNFGFNSLKVCSLMF